jgi:hypothetical protein
VLNFGIGVPGRVEKGSFRDTKYGLKTIFGFERT